MLAVDNSFSMRQGDRLERAKREAAAALLADCAPKIAARCWHSARKCALMGESASDTALRAAIHAIQPSDERSSYAELARALRSHRAIGAACRSRRTCFPTCRNRRCRPASPTCGWRMACGWFPIRWPTSGWPNFAVESVTAPRRIYDPKKVRIQATVAGFGTERATRRVSLVLNGREIDSKTVDVPANGRATRGVPRRWMRRYGMNRGEVRIDSGDDFPADDHFYFSVERADPRPVLFVHERAQRSATLLYFRTALEAVARMRPSRWSRAGRTRPPIWRFAQVRLRGALRRRRRCRPLSRQALRELRARRRIAAGRARPRSRRCASACRCSTRRFVETRYCARDGDRFQTVASLDPAHPSIAATRSNWDDVKFYQAVRVEPGQGARGGAALRRDAAAARKADRRRPRAGVRFHLRQHLERFSAACVASCRSWSRRRIIWARLDERPANFTVGSYLELRQAKEQGAAVEVLDPDGAARADAGRSHARAEHPARPRRASTMCGGPTGITSWWP